MEIAHSVNNHITKDKDDKYIQIADNMDKKTRHDKMLVMKTNSIGEKMIVVGNSFEIANKNNYQLKNKNDN